MKTILWFIILFEGFADLELSSSRYAVCHGKSWLFFGYTYFKLVYCGSIRRAPRFLPSFFFWTQKTLHRSGCYVWNSFHLLIPIKTEATTEAGSSRLPTDRQLLISKGPRLFSDINCYNWFILNHRECNLKCAEYITGSTSVVNGRYASNFIATEK